MTYDPTDPNDPLRHRFLDRRDFDGEWKMPIEAKIANGLGVSPDRFRELEASGVHIEQVPRRMRTLARLAGA